MRLRYLPLPYFLHVQGQYECFPRPVLPQYRHQIEPVHEFQEPVPDRPEVGVLWIKDHKDPASLILQPQERLQNFQSQRDKDGSLFSVSPY